MCYSYKTIYSVFQKEWPDFKQLYLIKKMCYSYKTNRKLLRSPPVSISVIVNALCDLHLLYGQHQRDSWIRPKRVWECLLSETLLQPWFCSWAHPSRRVMVEHKHVLSHIPIRKSHMMSCLRILGSKSVVPSLWVPWVQSIDATFSITNVSVCSGTNSGI